MEFPSAAPQPAGDVWTGTNDANVFYPEALSNDGTATGWVLHVPAQEESSDSWSKSAIYDEDGLHLFDENDWINSINVVGTQTIAIGWHTSTMSLYTPELWVKAPSGWKTSDLTAGIKISGANGATMNSRLEVWGIFYTEDSSSPTTHTMLRNGKPIELRVGDQLFNARSLADNGILLSEKSLLIPVGLIYDKAVNSPWWKTDLGTTELFDPRNPTVPDEQKAIDSALTIYYNKVRDDQGVVNDFDIQLLFGPVPGATWTKFDGPTGPDTGTLQNANQGDAKYSKPKKGGLYRFDLHYTGKTARAQAWLPKAGPDISSYWQSEVDYFHNTWGTLYRAKLAIRTDYFSMRPDLWAIAKHAQALADMRDIGNNLDWHNPGSGDMIQTATSPAGGPQNKTHFEWRYTIKNRVIDFRKRNNMMYALIAREMGLFSPEIYYGPDLTSAGSPDTDATFSAYAAGIRLQAGDSLESVMNTYGYAMQEPDSWAQREWPSDETTSQGLVRPIQSQLNALIQ